MIGYKVIGAQVTRAQVTSGEMKDEGMERVLRIIVHCSLSIVNFSISLYPLFMDQIKIGGRNEDVNAEI